MFHEYFKKSKAGNKKLFHELKVFNDMVCVLPQIDI